MSRRGENIHKRKDKRWEGRYIKVCICYLTENKGGTFYTVNYANTKQLKIVNVAELI